MLVLRNVTLIDATGSPARPGTTIVIEGNRIVQVGPEGSFAVPSSANVVDGTGKYVIPGLWDMHVHLSKAKSEALPVLIANGITSVRDMGGDLQELRGWQQQIDAGTLIGPRIKTPGPMLEAPATIERMRALPTNENWSVTRVAVPDSASAQTIVDSVAALGVDFIKIREAVSTVEYAAVVRAARAAGMMVVGHPPYSMDPVEAANLGMASLEHASYPYPLSDDPETRSRIIQAFLENDVAMVPTLASWQISLMDTDSLQLLVQDSLGLRDPRRRLISDFLAQEWLFDVESDERKNDATLGGWQGFFDRQALDLRAMHDAGIPMLPGSDLAGPSLFPGYSLHDELENLVKLVGLTPMEVIQSATLAPARFFDLESELGTVEVGKLADLVLLSQNPLDDIANSRTVFGVVLNGRYLGPDKIRELLGGLSPETTGTIELPQRRE